MKAVITAGGKGTRLKAITNDVIPKPMAILAGKPLLLHAVENLKKYGVKEFFFSVGHLGNIIKDYFGNGEKFGVKIEYIEETSPLGSCGALYYVKDKLKGDFIFCSGDLYFDVNVDKMLAFHRERKSEITAFTHPNLHPYDSDLVITDKDNRILRYDFKNSERNYYFKNNVNAGFFIVNESALDFFEKPDKYSMEHDFVASIIAKGRNVFSYKSPEYVKDAGTPERFTAIEKDVYNGIPKARCLNKKQKAIFLDRDGVINEYKGFITNSDQIELTPTAIEAIKKINESNYLAIVVSNQPVIARGECSFSEVEKCFDKIETILGEKGAYLDGRYYCPHHPHKGFDGEVKELKIECDCRKPRIGMLLKAVKDFNLDLSACYIIGDSENDVLTGKNANIPQVKIKSSLIEEEKTPPTYRAENLLSAVNLILLNTLNA